MNKTLLENMRFRTAEGAVGASTVRGAGVPGVARAARGALKRVNLSRFKVRSRARFLTVLGQETERVRRKLPEGARHWGIARKVLNIFLRDVVYNRHLSSHFGLSRIEGWLELPLDSHVAKGIRASSNEDSLPRWKTVKGLTRDVSDRYQTAARRIAKEEGDYPIHLEYYWFRV
jgi:hypothetical protein